MKIAVIGGGIGGLSAALQLLKAGLDVHVYEQAPRITEIGAGIQISPNASRLLHRLSLGPAMDTVGVRPVAMHQRRWDDGRTLQRAPVGREVETTFGAPYYHFHRADLVTLLADAMPAERLHVGHRLVDLEQKDGRVAARFENGVTVEADLLVGADGIHSRAATTRRWCSNEGGATMIEVCWNSVSEPVLRAERTSKSSAFGPVGHAFGVRPALPDCRRPPCCTICARGLEFGR